MKTVQQLGSRIAEFWKRGCAGKVVIGVVGVFFLCVACAVCLFGFTLTPAYRESATRVAEGGTATAQAVALAANATATERAKPTQTSLPTNTGAPTDTPRPSDTAAPSSTPLPTNTLMPSDTPRATDTPAPPTATPEPTKTFTPLPTPKPIVASGNGDAVVKLENQYEVAIVHITGNAGSRFFAVKNFGSDGTNYDLLVNTTEPYDGVRPLDFNSGQHTTRFEVKAEGKWKIEILPVTAAVKLNAPGKLEGKGDQVIVLSGGKPDTAKIQGNAAKRFFAVKSYGDVSDLLVNTVDPYNGEVIVDSSTLVLEVRAEGPWSIEVMGQ
ncbi:MAG: hypothetical protein MOGMAGMI_02503 [Candidatus Omnitrophica bacterium]|nr:hypothetical protein [Candidatus Omnitrophota bacterium]